MSLTVSLAQVRSVSQALCLARRAAFHHRLLVVSTPSTVIRFQSITGPLFSLLTMMVDSENDLFFTLPSWAGVRVTTCLIMIQEEMVSWRGVVSKHKSSFLYFCFIYYPEGMNNFQSNWTAPMIYKKGLLILDFIHMLLAFQRCCSRCADPGLIKYRNIRSKIQVYRDTCDLWMRLLSLHWIMPVHRSTFSSVPVWSPQLTCLSPCTTTAVNQILTDDSGALDAGDGRPLMDQR